MWTKSGLERGRDRPFEGKGSRILSVQEKGEGGEREREGGRERLCFISHCHTSKECKDSLEHNKTLDNHCYPSNLTDSTFKTAAVLTENPSASSSDRRGRDPPTSSCRARRFRSQCGSPVS